LAGVSGLPTSRGDLELLRGRETCQRGRAQKITLMLKQADERRNFIRGKSKLGSRKNLGIFLEHSGRKARPHEPLLDGEKQQGFIARGRDQGRYEDIRI